MVLACLYLCSASSWQGKTLGDLEKTLEGCKCMNLVDFFQPLGFIESEIGMGHAKQGLNSVEEPSTSCGCHAQDNCQTQDGGGCARTKPCSVGLWKWLAAGKPWVMGFAKGSRVPCG